jgi:SnoaL-like domain
MADDLTECVVAQEDSEGPGCEAPDRRTMLRRVGLGAAGVAVATLIGTDPAAASGRLGGVLVPGHSRRRPRSAGSTRERLDRLEAEGAIEETLYAYGSALDYGGLEQFLGCFTEDADYVVTFRIDSGRRFSFHGHEELTAYFNGHTHAPAAWHKHITTNPSITVEGHTATAMSYFIRVDAGARSGPSTITASGRYLDELVADEEGGWRIRSRVAEVENL